MAVSKFLLISPPRTGSTAIRMALAQIPGVFCHGEVLARTRPIGFFKMPADGEKLRNENRIKYYEATAIKGYTTTGIKVLHRQLFDEENAGLLQMLSERKEIAVLHLWRRDLCSRYISSLNFRAAQRPGRDPIVASKEAMLENCRNSVAHYKLTRKLFDDHANLTVCFEDILKQGETVWPLVQDLLGAPHGKIILPQKEAKSKAGFVNYVANVDELRACYDAVREEFEMGF